MGSNPEKGGIYTYTHIICTQIILFIIVTFCSFSDRVNFNIKGQLRDRRSNITFEKYQQHVTGNAAEAIKRFFVNSITNIYINMISQIVSCNIKNTY